jgi:hypothetical protein
MMCVVVLNVVMLSVVVPVPSTKTLRIRNLQKIDLFLSKLVSLKLLTTNTLSYLVTFILKIH